jgi:hypothetical protein
MLAREMMSDQTPDPRLEDPESRRGWIENIMEFVEFYVLTMPPDEDEDDFIGFELESLDKMAGGDLAVLSAAVDKWKQEKWPETSLDDFKPRRKTPPDRRRRRR